MFASSDKKYLLWGSVLALSGAAAFVYVFYPRGKKQQLYEDFDHSSAERLEVEEEESDHIEKQRDILVVGLASSGKSAILASMCGSRSQDFRPTDGFNVVSFLNPQGIRLNLVELGGAEKNRKYWRHFYTKKNMVVLVIDASNESTLSQSASLFMELLAEENLSGLPFIVVANKQDRSDALDGDAVMKSLKSSMLDPSLQKRNIYHVQTQAPFNGTHKGIFELKNLISTCK